MCMFRVVELDVPIKCDSCIFQIYSKCYGLTVSGQKCLTLKNCYWKTCLSREKGLNDIPELKQLITQL